MPRYKTTNLEELKKVSYLDCSRLEGRLVPLQPCLNDDGEWELWLPGPNGLVNTRAVPVESDYFARAPEKETDVYFDFINVMTKHAYWPDLAFFIDGIRNDIHNLGACLAKVDLFFELSKEGNPVSRFVATETEYIFTVCRSVFDLLQEVISRLWQRVQLHDQTIDKRNLPKTFRKMVLRDNKLMPSEQIRDKYNIPEQLADFYSETGAFFNSIKDYRDEIIHSGKGFDLIFQTERGFAVRKDVYPFSSFDIWKEQDLLPNNLAPLRPAIAHVIHETLASCERFTDILKRTIQLPPDIAPGFSIFVRGFYTEHLLKLREILENEPWWE